MLWFHQAFIEQYARVRDAPPLARGRTLPAITPGVTQLAPAATQGEVYGLALLALPPQAAAVEWPPGLGIALLDRGQRQHLRTCLLH